jgi:hypothetical protein
MHQGSKSIGKDGREYRSDLEKEFSDKFLHGNFYSEYENSYGDGSKRTCDFYLPIFKLWIEVVPYNYDLFKSSTTYFIPEKIFLDANYSDKEIVKREGASWNNTIKKWYILKQQYEHFQSDSLKKYLPTFKNDNEYLNENNPMFKNFFTYYENIQYKKNLIESRGELFCTVHPEDINCQSLMHMLQVKGFDGWKFIRSIENSNVNKIIESRTVEVSDREDVLNQVIRFIKNPSLVTNLTCSEKSLLSHAIIDVLKNPNSKEKISKKRIKNKSTVRK